jgi:hypothetical protein
MENQIQIPGGAYSTARCKYREVERATSLLLVLSCAACGGAQSVDFWSDSAGGSVTSMIPAAAGAVANSGAGSGGASIGGASIGGASIGGASIGGAGGVVSAGAGGATAGASAVTVEPPIMRSLIDDMEANVSTIPERDGRAGVWYTFDDGQGGTQSPAPFGPFLPDPTDDGLPGSTRARRTQGSGFTSYAGFGFDLNNQTGTRQSYDASAYTGIVFWMLSSANVRVLFPTVATAPTNEGGTCTTACDDSFGRALTPSQTWTEYTVAFAELQQLSEASSAQFDPKTLLGIAISVQAGQQFDVWLDDVGFY